MCNVEKKQVLKVLNRGGLMLRIRVPRVSFSSLCEVVARWCDRAVKCPGGARRGGCPPGDGRQEEVRGEEEEEVKMEEEDRKRRRWRER